MNFLIEKLEKAKPFFNKMTDNMYMTAIRNGFMTPMYVILFSSIFMMIAYIPNVWGFIWDPITLGRILRPYQFTMGFFGIFVCMTVAKALTDEINKRKMEKTKRLDTTAVMIASAASYLIMLGDTVRDAAGAVVGNAVSTAYMSAGGIFVGLIIAFVTPNVYKLCTKHNITIRLPEAVPPSIAESFKSVFAFGISVMIFWIFDIAFRSATSMNLAMALTKTLAPLFALGDSYAGVAIVAGALSLFWFVGIHGPSIVMPALAPIMITNFAGNQEAFANGLHAASPFTSQLQTFIACFGGTGATFVTVLLFAFLSKSKQNKAVGKAALLPTLCGINEPILFGGPLILNPIFFVPFLVAPIFNAILFKFFVTNLGMNGFVINVPWTCPAPIAIPLGTNLHVLSFVLVAIILVVNFLIYYPFFKAYDHMILENEQENERLAKAEPVKAAPKAKAVTTGASDQEYAALNGTSVLVLCIGGGTSGMLANALTKGAKEHNIQMECAAAAYGTHEDIIADYNVVILAPQAASYYDTLKLSTDSNNSKLLTTNGPLYVQLSKDSDKALQFIMEHIKD